MEPQVDPEVQADLEAQEEPETLVPLHTFPIQDVFAWRHEQGTLIEMANEAAVLKQINQSPYRFTAWPISPIPGLTTSFFKPWLFLVKLPKADEGLPFPALTDRFRIDMEEIVELPEGRFSLVHLSATRIPNPYENFDLFEGTPIQRYAALKVDVPRSWQNDDGPRLELDLMEHFRIATSVNDIANVKMDHSNSQLIAICWDVNSTTFDKELAALRYLTEVKRSNRRGPGPRSLRAFKTIHDFAGSAKNFTNLLAHYPHLDGPKLSTLPPLLLRKYKSFNHDHKAAFVGLSQVPNGLYFVNGCPGAGKTEWNMIVSALIQAKPRSGSKRKRSPILFLVDINQAVDDAANRYFRLCQETGLRLRIIRMHGWPYEMRNSSTINKGGKDDEKEESSLDFTKRFLTTASIEGANQYMRSQDKAPTLDEAAWDYYATHQGGAFSTLRKVLSRLDEGLIFDADDWKALRSLVGVLYQAVLAQADFVATTPVAACDSFARLFRPDIVFIDEAPHARELTTLIPIAYFEPMVWIFTGDVKQTRPFVKGLHTKDIAGSLLKWNPYAEQLRVSTMARAAAVDYIDSKLLVNNRAFANLHLLSSKMFYDGRMSSCYRGSELYPPPTRHLQRYLERLGSSPSLKENRIVIWLKDSREERWGSSFWNPTHHKWLLEHVQELLQDGRFRTIGDDAKPGTIMIQTPYSSAMRLYNAEVKQWCQEWKDRTQVVTVDRSQGTQADVVFLDMVRSSSAGFMDDPQRLNVAITRARQAEIILMHRNMTRRYENGKALRALYLKQIWDDAIAGQRLFKLQDESDAMEEAVMVKSVLCGPE